MKIENKVVDDLFQNVNEVPTKTDYWFVRTDYGYFFDTYLKNSFIAIGWNNVTLEELKNPDSIEKIRQKLIISEKRDINSKKTKGAITSIINKLNNFINLKKGDIVIIPSRNSTHYAFGIIQESEIFIDIDKSNDCDYYKRKRVKWIAVKTMKELDPHFYKMRFTQHTISKIEDYSAYIDNVVNSLYRKNDNTHFVIDIKTTEDINVNSLLSLIENIQNLTLQINDFFGLNEQIEKSSIRLNLQSPGQIEFKLPIGKSLITLATILSLTCCSNNKEESKSNVLNDFISIHGDTIDKIRNSMDELEVDKEKINSFTYGHQ